MSRRLPPFSALRSFEAAARTLSFTRAADTLHVTPTAISHQIKSLESWLGVRLFERTTRAMRLTPRGAQYLETVQAAFDALEAGTARIAERAEDRVVNVSTTMTFTTKWLIPRLEDFQTRHPAVDVRISTSMALVDFEQSGADIAVRYGRGKWEGLSSYLLMVERVFPICSPRLLSGEHPVREVADLERHTLLNAAQMPDQWRMWLTAAGHPTLRPARELTFDQIVTVVEAALEGLGVGLGYTNLVASDLAAGRLVAPFDLEVPGTFAYYVVHPDTRPLKPSAAAFRDWLLSSAHRGMGERVG
jgi:LysR family transcriptional regulator, glycine cleavage system transcriptional activator